MSDQLYLNLKPRTAMPPRVQVVDRPSFNRRWFDTVLASNGLTELVLYWAEGATQYEVRHARKRVGLSSKYSEAFELYDGMVKAEAL